MARVFFIHPSFLSKSRKKTVLDMIDKKETARVENGENFTIRYNPDGQVRICIVDAETGGRASWAITRARIK